MTYISRQYCTRGSSKHHEGKQTNKYAREASEIKNMGKMKTERKCSYIQSNVSERTKWTEMCETSYN